MTTKFENVLQASADKVKRKKGELICSDEQYCQRESYTCSERKAEDRKIKKWSDQTWKREEVKNLSGWTTSISMRNNSHKSFTQ